MIMFDDLTLNLRWLALLAASAMLACSEQVPTPHEIVYEDPKLQKIIALRVDRGELTDGHIVWSYVTCDGEYRCIRSGAMHFAVPKRVDVGQAWTMDNFRYAAVGSEQVQLKRSSVEAIRIELVTDNKNRYWYLFSDLHGLVSFGSPSGDRPTSYVLKGLCGFGAAKNCKDK